MTDILSKRLRINIRPDQIFDFTEKVKPIMYEVLHEESFDIASESMVQYIIRDQGYVQGYNSTFMWGIGYDREIGRAHCFNTLIMYLEFIRLPHEEYLLGEVMPFKLHDKLLVLPEVEDWTAYRSLPDDEYKRRYNDWVVNVQTEEPHQAVQYVLPHGDLHIGLYVPRYYTDADWERFWKETFDHERIFKAAVNLALDRYIIKKDVSKNWLRRKPHIVNYRIAKLYKEHPEYVEVPEFNIELRGTDELCPQVKQNIPEEWLEETLELWKDNRLWSDW